MSGNIGPTSLWNLFSDEWLVTRQAKRLFGVACVTLIASAPMATGWVSITASSALWQRVAGALCGVCSAIAIPFLWIGMWRYWARTDDSSASLKGMWFVVLLFGLFYGACLYYCCVYLRQMAERHEGVT